VHSQPCERTFKFAQPVRPSVCTYGKFGRPKIMDNLHVDQHVFLSASRALLVKYLSERKMFRKKLYRNMEPMLWSLCLLSESFGFRDT
jgi:hypothetical protein